MINVFRANQDTGPLISLSFKTSLRALSNTRSHNLSHILREERDIIADSDQEARGTCMVAHFDLALDQLVRVQEHQLVEKLIWNPAIRTTDVFEGV